MKRFLTPSGVAFVACLSIFASQLSAQTTQPIQPMDPPGDGIQAIVDDVDAIEVTECAECHTMRGPGNKPVPFSALLRASVHSDLSCDMCHADISMDDLDRDAPNPHGEIAPVNCGDCHDSEAEIYTRHGRLEIGQDPDLPSCWSCHGAHDIVRVTDTRSRVHPLHLARTCQTCHTDLNIVKRHAVLRAGPIEMYENSIHGRTVQKGFYVSATCNDCHAAKDDEGKRTAHRILSPNETDSPIHHFNIAGTCGSCHRAPAQDYLTGIHGQAMQLGEVEAPVCTTCHGEHGIIKADDPRSPVSPTHLAEQTCAPCHESAVLNEKFGLAAGRLASYVDSYHGLKSKAGDVGVANCASCHGAHLILPSTDPRSSINPSNLRHTCGECHPGITAQLAQTPIHGTAGGLHTGWAEIFRKIYIVLIVATIGGMLLHNIADWVRYVKNMAKQPYVQRLTTSEVIQHWILMLSFVTLVITGFALRFSEAWWVKMMFGWGGGKGFEYRGTIHRTAAVIMVFGALWHFIYLFTPRGRHWLRDMVAGVSDFRHLWHNILYFLGRREEEAKFNRFSYMEKAEYWALVWGTIIMTGTGVLLWFDAYFNRFVPKGFLDVMLVIHYYEAWLATLAIFVWHIYGTMFKPAVWPMNPAWLSGRMPKLMYMHEHPEGPRLKARVVVPRYEEEVEDSAGAGGHGNRPMSHSPDHDE